MKSIIAFFVKRGVLVNLISVILLLGGIYSAMQMQREAFPSINFDVIAVSGAYPGAAPREVERLMVAPIEQELKGIDGINVIRSTAYSGTMQITIEVDPNFEDRSRLVSDIQQAINRADLPVDLPADPMIMEVKSEQTPVLTFSIFGDFEPLALKHLSAKIEDDVRDIHGVANVFVQGDRKEEIRIVPDPEKMRRSRISIHDIMALVRGWNINAPGGRLKATDGQSIIRITGEFLSAEDAGNLVLRANERGQALYLKDVAEVTETLERPYRYVAARGDPAITMIVIKKGDADIITLVDKVRAYLDTIPQKYGEEVHVSAYNDFSTITRLRLGVLTSNGTIGLALVLVMLMLFLRPAVALTTAWGLPIIFFAGIGLLYAMGITLNLLVMFGFIMVLGLMVDDAIIIGENATYHMERGLSPEQAAIEGTYELMGPVTATVLTTIVAFMPLLFMDGIIGKFIANIPLVVVILLAFSWFEAIFILPNHIRDVANANKHPKERVLFIWITAAYTWLLEKAVRLRYLTILITIAALLGSFALAGTMKFQLFPSGAESTFYLRVTMPTGTTLEEMRDNLKKLDSEVRKRIDPALLETTTMIAGENSADQREALKQIGDRFGFERIILIPFTERTVKAHDVMSVLKSEIPPLFPKLDISFAMESPGPPVGRALQVELTGGDEATMTRVAKRLVAQLQTIKGVYAVESDLEPGDPEVRIVMDRKLAAYAGVDLATASTHIRAAFDGLRVSTIKRGKEEIDVTIRYPEQAQRDINTLMKLEIPNQRGGLIPLHRIAHLESREGTSSIRHKDARRVINVSAEVDKKNMTSKELNAIVLQSREQWLADDAEAVHVNLGGEEEKTQESVRGLAFSFLFALLGIFAILAVQFNRVGYPILVMLAIPFGVIGIVAGFFLHGAPLSFMAMMGFVALTGVVVNSSLVMAVFIQRQINDGVPWRNAIMESGRRRLRAVLLTAITTVVGLLPTAYGWGGHDPFVAPMALALSWGLMFSTVITLFSVPAALGIALDIKQKTEQLLGKEVTVK
ncbi:efflux RND transporter permease subunit [Mariprofundus sp. KV]|uniref:efflux RND transporter permease subunit n=1 Tax=Mariprofundus sp. KV TaxID=2608715 RepID=UPI0015A282A7|nr:efflux RND transporter permease subunit [Mariprofundus sp. KV]NWF36210.1 efflux RND transporter permease subunit [Mariprofundus sp. KV]